MLVNTNEKPQQPKKQFLRSKIHFASILSLGFTTQCWTSGNSLNGFQEHSTGPLQDAGYREVFSFIYQSQASTKKGNLLSSCYLPFTHRWKRNHWKPTTKRNSSKDYKKTLFKNSFLKFNSILWLWSVMRESQEIQDKERTRSQIIQWHMGEKKFRIA